VRLPNITDPNDYDETYRLQSKLWMPAVQEICQGHRIPFDKFHAFENSSNLVASISDRFIVKIFPKFLRHQWEGERRVLSHLWEQKLDFPIPELIAQGEREDEWAYLIFTKLPGLSLNDVWPQCSESEKAGLLREIGAVMAKVHALPVAGISDLEPEWNSFLDGQKTRCRARHQHFKMPDWFLSELDRFVERTQSLLVPQPSVILTGEYTPFNLLVDGSPGNWRLSGMVDFGDAMIGFREYDFLGPCLFLAEGNPRLVTGLFDGYGYRSFREDKHLRTRLMLLAILHRYSNLNFQIRIPNWASRVRSIDELQQLLFPVAVD